MSPFACHSQILNSPIEGLIHRPGDYSYRKKEEKNTFG